MITIDSNGWIRGQGCECVPSPFFDEREGTRETDLIVMHNISLPAGVFGLGYVQTAFAKPGTEIYLDNRGRKLKAQVVKPPFRK